MSGRITKDGITSWAIPVDLFGLEHQGDLFWDASGCFFKLFGLLPSNGFDALKLLCLISKSEHISSFLEDSPQAHLHHQLGGVLGNVKPCLKKHQRTLPATLKAVQDGIVRQTRCADYPGVLRIDKLIEFCLHFCFCMVEVEESTIVLDVMFGQKVKMERLAFLDQLFSGSIYNGIHLHLLAVIGNLQRLYLFDAHFGTVLFLELSMHQNWLRLSLLWPLSECHARHQHSHSTMKRLIQLIPNPSKLVHPFSDFRSTHHIYPIDSIHFIPFPHHQPFLLGSGSWTPRNCACMERSNLEPCCHWLQLLPNEGSSWLGRYRAWRWSFMPLYLTTNIYQYPPRNESKIPPSKTETIIFNIPKRPILTPSPRNPNGSIKAHSVHSNVPTAR